MIQSWLAKALAPSPAVYARPHAANYDTQRMPVQTGGWFGDVHRGTYGLTFQQLDAVASAPLLSVPPSIRAQQVAARCRVATGVNDPMCWWVVPDDPRAEVTDATRKTAREIERVIMNAGGPFTMPPSATGHGDMGQAMWSFMNDSMRFDQAVFEILRTYGGRIVGWLPQDARTFRLRNPTAEEIATRQRFGNDPGLIYRQIDSNGAPIRDFGPEDLCFFVRRARTDERFIGYGWPEYDQGWRQAASVMKTWTSNDVKFDNGIHAAVLVLVRAMMGPDAQADFTRNMMGMLSGVQNTGRAVISFLQPELWQNVGREDVDIKQIGQSNQEMEFTQWLHLGIKEIFGLYMMDSTEAGRQYGNEGQTSSWGDSGTLEKNTASQVLGLWPLLDRVANAFTASIVKQIHPEFRMAYTGRPDPNYAQRIEQDKRDEVNVWTVNDLRRARNLPPLPYREADSPLSLLPYLNREAPGGGGGPFVSGVAGVPSSRMEAPRGPLDGLMRGCRWDDVDDYTTRYLQALQAEPRLTIRNGVWTADLTK